MKNLIRVFKVLLAIIVYVVLDYLIKDKAEMFRIVACFALLWFFLSLIMGGWKKGVPVGVTAMLLVISLSLYAWFAVNAKSLAKVYGELTISVATIGLLALSIYLPIALGAKLWKRFNAVKPGPTKEETAEKKKEKREDETKKEKKKTYRGKVAFAWRRRL